MKVVMKAVMISGGILILLAALGAAAIVAGPLAPLAGIRVMDAKYDVTASANPWWLEKIHCPRDIRAADIGRNVVVAVVDTGTDGEDFPFPNIMRGYNALSGGVDTRDRHGHGRMLSHLIGSPVIGVNPYATILPVKVRNTMMDNPRVVSRGIVWAADHGADIINLSLGRQAGSGGSYKGYLPGVEYAVSRGILVVASAGTAGTELFYPGACEGVVSVGGLDVSYRYRSRIPAGDIDIFAVDTKSSVSTSFPTAIVSGAVSLVMAVNPVLSARGAMDILLEAADIMTVNNTEIRVVNVEKAIHMVKSLRGQE